MGILVPAMVMQFTVGGAMLPFTTVFLDERGLRENEIGQLLSVVAILGTLVPLLWGWLADRWIALNRLLVGLNVAGVFGLTFMSNQFDFMGLLAGYSLFYIAIQPSLSLLSALAFHHLDSPAKHFGPLRSWGAVGWILPSLPIALALALNRGLKLDLALRLGAGLAAATAILFLFLPYTPPRGRGADRTGVAAYWTALRKLLRQRTFVPLLVVAFLMFSSFTTQFYYTPLYLKRLGLDTSWVGPIQGLGTALEIPLFFLLPALLRRFGYRGCITMGCMALVFRHTLFYFNESLWLLSASYFLSGVAVVMFMIPTSMVLNEIASPAVRATAQTTYAVAGAGLGQICSHQVVRWAAEQSADPMRSAFLIAAVISGVAAVITWNWVRDVNGPGQSLT